MEALNKIRGYRVMAGLSQDEMADALNLSRVSYAAKENGKADFKHSEMLVFLEKIKEVDPNVTLNDIFM